MEVTAGNFTPRLLYCLAKSPRYPLNESGLAPETVWTFLKLRKYLAAAGNHAPSVQSVVQSLHRLLVLIIYWRLQLTACTMYKEHNKNCTCNQFNKNEYLNLKVINRDKRNMKTILVKKLQKKHYFGW
jgi:hypothetical protein